MSTIINHDLVNVKVPERRTDHEIQLMNKNGAIILCSHRVVLT